MVQQKSVRVKERDKKKGKRKGEKRKRSENNLVVRTQIITLWSGGGAVGSSELF